MKNLRIAIAMICIACFSANAQITVNVNTVTEPKPVVVRYYYLPEAQAYYDADRKTYIYRTAGKWTRVKKLPPGQAKKVRWIKLSNYNGSTPYNDFETHRVTYAKVVAKPGKVHHKKVKVHKKK